MNNILILIGWVGTIETIILILGIVYGIILWARGIAPVLFRLGNGLARKEIALFAKNDNLQSIKSLLIDSRLFKEKNIRIISSAGDINTAEKSSLFLVVWADWSANIDQILAIKRNECALIVYAPYDKGRISDDQMIKIDGKRHTAVSNFRGRLLNDIVASMITTSYEKK
jgi:hypothetical protein